MRKRAMLRGCAWTGRDRALGLVMKELFGIVLEVFHCRRLGLKDEENDRIWTYQRSS